ncbi:hypothetical protein M406DRAFT_100935 [Cryphonectria parasitica EP155]|uniref:Uncharacterized protein n=1 Tax=Cryphonectria parasitica (strain ATCC 38755 / EP155) TaxID=660469 RepID=A0A9P4YCJ3_CRYP1|nr:uncharacterized protein M406DRAFT_100935 [Cryphonectria parasitica EP155]KAF3770560.1 hypothetical protein M406DRAFT_100935 [Cryphonectria parasitica EP155]
MGSGPSCPSWLYGVLITERDWFHTCFHVAFLNLLGNARSQRIIAWHHFGIGKQWKEFLFYGFCGARSGLISEGQGIILCVRTSKGKMNCVC